MSKQVVVVFIPTAGARKVILHKNGQPVSFIWHLPPIKRLVEKFRKKGVFTVEYPPTLKEETIARLRTGAETYFANPWSNKFVFVTGGQTSRREPGKDSAGLMAEWLKERGIDPARIVSDSQTLHTGEKASAVFEWLRKEGVEEAEIYIVTSWYHIPRMQFVLARAFRKQNFLKRVVFTKIWVFTPLTKESLLYEYLYNIITEPLKCLLSLFPGFKKWYGKWERKARGIGQDTPMESKEER